MHKNKKSSYCCRVCGLEQDFQPWGEDGKTPAFEICGCCGVEFGYQDCNPEYVKKFRANWLQEGSKWICPEEKPLYWSLQGQLKQIPEEWK